MSGHTPGPWVVEQIYDGTRTIAQMRSCESLVCVNTFQFGAPSHHATEANASLMATAPELLDALRASDEALAEAREMLGVFEDLAIVDHMDAARKANRAAIAKAEGRQ